MLRVLLHRSKVDPYGKGVFIHMGRTSSPVCPMAAMLGYLAVHPAGEGPLFVFRDGNPLSRDCFVKEVRSVLSAAHIDHEAYFSHSFRIGATTMAAQAGLPAYMIKMLGQWTSDVYQIYVRMPQETLAAVVQSIAQ